MMRPKRIMSMQQLGRLVAGRDKAESKHAASIFNETTPVGSAVRYYPSRRSDHYTVHATRSAALISPSGVVVVFVTGMQSAVPIDNIEVVA